jgi:hypothetical protein
LFFLFFFFVFFCVFFFFFFIFFVFFFFFFTVLGDFVLSKRLSDYLALQYYGFDVHYYIYVSCAIYLNYLAF